MSIGAPQVAEHRRTFATSRRCACPGLPRSPKCRQPHPCRPQADPCVPVTVEEQASNEAMDCRWIGPSPGSPQRSCARLTIERPTCVAALALGAWQALTHTRGEGNAASARAQRTLLLLDVIASFVSSGACASAARPRHPKHAGSGRQLTALCAWCMNCGAGRGGGGAGVIPAL